VKILNVITRLYAHCSIVILRVLSLFVIPPGDYPINRDIKSRTQKLLDVLPGNTSHLVSEVGSSDSIGFFRSGYTREYVTICWPTFLT
jgi:hypothetical protein